MGSTRKALLGAFVIVGLLLFAGGLFLIGDRRLLFRSQFELYSSFGKVTGLQAGAKVRVAGLDAGEVLDILIPSRPSEKFRVRMRLREDLRPLVRRDSVCTIQTDGIVGNAFVQIARGADEAPMVSPGDTIEGHDPIEFADLIQEGRDTFRIVTREAVDLNGELRKTLTTINETVQTADGVLTEVGSDLKRIMRTASHLADDLQVVVADARHIANDVKAGRGTVGRLLTDDSQYQRWARIVREVEHTMINLRETTGRARAFTDQVTARDGAAPQMMQSLRDTLVDTHEVISDLSEATEALKRNFLFRGFFRQRGFFDLHTISRDAYLGGALEGRHRTALRIWIDAAMLFSRAPDGSEQLSEGGRRRLDSAMADLVRYPRDSPLVVEGYAEPSARDAAYPVSAERARRVRDYLLDRFGRQTTLTSIMPLSDEAQGSPRGDNRWSGVALALFVENDALAKARKRQEP